MQRYELTPEKLEMNRGKLLWSQKDRVNLLGLLLENVGADCAGGDYRRTSSDCPSLSA